MKGILLTNGKAMVYNVYTKDVLDRLDKVLDLDHLCYTKEDIDANPTGFQDVDVIFSTWGMPSFTEEEITKVFPSLKAVFYGAGSVQQFAKPFLNKGIKVISAWGANAVPVAEYTVAQIILSNKGYMQGTIKNGNEGRKAAYEYCHTFPGTYKTKVGIIGAGMIGKDVIALLKPFQVDILVFDPFLPDEKAAELGVKKCSLEELFSQCQTISNHLANNPQTVGMLNYEVFKLMKDNATFINTGRGAQVVEDDLVRALQEKPDRTALLDVTFPEPPEEGHPFYTMPNVFLTPHIAGSMSNEVERMAEYMADEFELYAAGKPMKYEVSLEMLKTMA